MSIGAAAPAKLMRVLRLMLIGYFPNLSSVQIFIRRLVCIIHTFKK
jgi:hypothetical protein